jgi:small nuclear ribonucleoprotein (snRNP)-like protein
MGMLFYRVYGIYLVLVHYKEATFTILINLPDSGNRLQGITDGFDLGMNMLLDGDKEDDGGSREPRSRSAGRKKHQKGGKKRKRH